MKHPESFPKLPKLFAHAQLPSDDLICAMKISVAPALIRFVEPKAAVPENLPVTNAELAPVDVIQVSVITTSS